ncbi:MAG: FtsW/RodA/SpoVE family cell cycle protein [Bacteroidales bacterium]|nr:FtsW/RodA/SpoVE family cell cycle protein [Bacteroidales bacterium]
MRLFNKLFQGDRVIWMVVLILAFISLLAVYSATGTYANSKFDGNNAFVLLSHAKKLLFGLIVLYAVHLVKYTYYSRFFQLAFWMSIPLLVYTMFFGADLNDAHRVFYLFGTSFQTSDLAKIALIGYLARELTIRQDAIKDFQNAFIPLMVPVLLVVGLIFPENFSTAAILFASSMVLLFVGRINFKYLMIFFGIALFAMSMYILIVINDNNIDDRRVGTWEKRIESFFRANDELTDEQRSKIENEEDFQEIQAKIAIAGGGLWGKMPGNSTQRNFLPHPYSDFIFAIIVEEYGLIGGAFVVLLYLILFFRAIKITTEIPQSFGGFLVFGLSFMMVLQAMINMGVAVDILPVTGQPLPFVSMGGTSLMFTGCAFGMILSVSKEVNKNKAKRNEPETT